MSDITISMKVFAKNDAIANTAITELQKLLHKDFKETPLDDIDIKFLSDDEVRIQLSYRLILSCNSLLVLILKHVKQVISLLIYAVFLKLKTKYNVNSQLGHVFDLENTYWPSLNYCFQIRK